MAVNPGTLLEPKSVCTTGCRRSPRPNPDIAANMNVLIAGQGGQWLRVLAGPDSGRSKSHGSSAMMSLVLQGVTAVNFDWRPPPYRQECMRPLPKGTAIARIADS